MTTIANGNQTLPELPGTVDDRHIAHPQKANEQRT